MDIRDYARDIILIIILLIATLALVTRLWYDSTIALGAMLMMLSLGALLLSQSIRIRSLERSIQVRDKAIRANLEEISAKMIQKYDASASHLDDVVNEFGKRIYR
jgi:hypothetical protein